MSTKYYRGATKNIHYRIESHPEYAIFFPSVMKDKYVFPMWKGQEIAEFFDLSNREYNKLLRQYGAVMKGHIDEKKGIRLGKHWVFETEKECQLFIDEVLNPKILSIVLLLN